MTRIAVIGGGRIGEALLAGLIGSGYDAKDLVVSEKSAARSAELASAYGIRATTIGDAAGGADVVVIAVKPGDVDSVLTEIGQVDREQLVVSLAAGIAISKMEPKLPAGCPVVRAMPNTPMLVGKGASAVAPGRYARPEHMSTVTKILETVGKVEIVTEAQIDAVTALSGSGPAYFFLVAEAMIDAGVSLGLSRAVASSLVVQTMVGSAAMLDQSGETPAELRVAVTSPGGTTAAAIRELEKNGLRAAFYEALSAAKDRSIEIGVTA